MCGRYTLQTSATQIKKVFDIQSCPEIKPHYNIAPQTDILIVHEKEDARRISQLARWGLIPHWAKDKTIAHKLINARAEGLATKPAFRGAFRHSRCIIPASGFYEWKVAQDNGRTSKQPYYIKPLEEGSLFGFAGLMEHWTSPEGQTLLTCCIITTEPNPLMAEIHNRMPAILEPEDYAAWLNPENHNTVFLETLLRPYAEKNLEVYPVSKDVNRTSIDKTELILPLEG